MMTTSTDVPVNTPSLHDTRVSLLDHMVFHPEIRKSKDLNFFLSDKILFKINKIIPITRILSTNNIKINRL